MMNWEDKCRDLERLCDRLRRKIEDSRDEISKLYRKLEDAEARVHELEPLKRARDAAYDQHVTNGGTDICFRNGMSNNCGPGCEAYGSKPECEAEQEGTGE